MLNALTKTRRRSHPSLVQDALGAVSLVIIMVGALHLPAFV